MSMDLSMLPEGGFEVTRPVIGGEGCYFIRPKPAFFDWTPELLKYRSSIWDSNGNLISGSYKKFFNLLEKPDIDPFPTELSNMSIMEKLDGSTLIISKYKGDLIVRTRGTIDASIMPNGHELQVIYNKYPEFFSLLERVTDTEDTFIGEWISSINRIILRYEDTPDFYLTSIVRNKDYSLWSQEEVDKVALRYKLKRPKRYIYETLQDLVQDVTNWEGKEGVCIYYNNDQCLKKCKSFHYLKLHTYKANLNLRNIAKVYFDSNYTSEYSFFNYLEQTFDFECATASKPFITDLFNILNQVKEEEARILSLIEATKDLSQKEYAATVMQALPKELSGMAFTLRKQGSLPKDLLIKRVSSIIEHTKSVLS